MAKTPSLKQQLIQELANQQVAQYRQAQQQNNDIAQLQAQYDAWQKQQEVSALEAQYNDWLKAQQPAQPEAPAIEAPTVEAPIVETAQKPIQKIPSLPKRSLRLEQEEAKMLQKEAQQKQALKEMDNSLRRNRLNDLAQIGLGEGKAEVGSGVKQLSELDKVLEQMKSLPTEEEDIENRIANLDGYGQQTELPRLTDEQKALEQQILNSDKAKVNSTEDDRNILPSFGWGVARIPFNIDKILADAALDVGGTIGEMGAGFVDDLTGHHDDKKNTMAVRDAIADKQAQVNENYDWMKEMENQSKENHPLAYGLGNLATQVGAYTVTNPVFDKMGAAIGGGSKAAGFIGNQIGQNVQDLALDTLPRYEEFMADGVLTDEEKQTLAEEGRNNAILNVIQGGLLEIPSITKAISDFKPSVASDNMAFFNNAMGKNVLNTGDEVVDAAAKQYAEAAENLENIAKQMPEAPKADIPKMEAPKMPETEIPEAPKAEAPKTELPKQPEMVDGVRQYIKNENLTPEANTKINSYLQQLDDVFDSPEVADAVSDIFKNVQSEEGSKLMIDYMDLSGELRKTTDPAQAEAIRAQLKELYGNLKSVKPEEKAFIKDMMDMTEVQNAINDYKIALAGSDKDAVKKAAQAIDNARNRIPRRKGADPRLSKAFGGSFGPVIKRPLNEFNFKETEDILDLIDDGVNPNKVMAEDAGIKNLNKPEVEGADPLQFFGNADKGEWKTSKFRTNTAENQGWGDELPTRDFAYKVFSEEAQKARAVERGQSFDDLMNKESFDEVDVKAAMSELQSMMDSGDARHAKRLARKLATEGREHGRGVQAFAEYNRNTAAGALQDASKVQEDIIGTWKSRNLKAKEGNSRIAKALSDMGHKPIAKETIEQTHEQIKKGVLAELEKEVGSVEKYFNDNDIEYLTQLAEDKSIPTWQITSEIEHKLKNGTWYTLDESTPIPKPTNTKLQSALNSLVNDQVRVEKPAPSLKQIREEVKNTLEKEFGDITVRDKNGKVIENAEGFTEDDIDYLANLIHEGATKDELAQALDLKMATGTWGISDETLQEVNNIFKQISQYDENSRQFVEGQAEAYRLLAEELVPNATAFEKFEAWRYLAMLGNPKTMLRNFIGNKTFGAVTGISNNIAAIAEAGIDKAVKAAGGEGIQRTKSVLNPVKDGDLIKASALDADASSYRHLSGSKYEKMDEDALRQAKSVFNSKFAKFYEKMTDAGISDYSAASKKYSTSLAGWLKANGYDKSIFDAETELARLKNLSETRLLSDAEKASMENLSKEVKDLDKAREYALKQADYATFHEDNKIAEVLSKWSRTSREEGTGIGSILIEGMIPFKKTPANVLRSGLEYSPLGAVDSIRRTGKLVWENTGARKGNLGDVYEVKKLLGKGTKEVNKELASDVIESWSKTLTGTGLTALGYYLYNKGILHSSDPDTKYQDQLEGHQNYAIEINGKSYTIDWAAPTVMPLMVGAELAKLWDSTGKDSEDFYNNIDSYLNAANRITDPLVETSMLQGVRDTLETAANYAKNDEALNILPLLGYNLATGYVSQAVPTAFGQVARTVDPVRRSTYTDKEGMVGVFDKQLKKQMNKIPGLSMRNEEYVDTYGRTQKNSPFNNVAGNLAYQMFSPGYLSNINETSADKVSREAYDVSGDTKTLPQWKSSFKVDGKRVSPKDYTKASKIYGNTQADIRAKLYNDPTYNSLSPEDKEDFIKKANSLSEKAAMEVIDPNFKPSEDYKTYKKDGIKGLLKKYKTNADYSEATDKYGLGKSNSKKEIFEEKGEEGLKTLADFQDYGKDNATYAYKRYEKAKSQIPGLTVKEYKNTVAKIDGLGDKGKKNGQISQTEMLAYLNNGSFTQEEVNKLWKDYGNDWEKMPKQKKDGTWYIPKK